MNCKVLFMWILMSCHGFQMFSLYFLFSQLAGCNFALILTYRTVMKTLARTVILYHSIINYS